MTLRERITDAIVSGLQNRVDGPGSDLQDVGELSDDGVWLYVRGDIDVHQLTTDIIDSIEEPA